MKSTFGAAQNPKTLLILRSYVCLTLQSMRTHTEKDQAASKEAERKNWCSMCPCHLPSVPLPSRVVALPGVSGNMI